LTIVFTASGRAGRAVSRTFLDVATDAQAPPVPAPAPHAPGAAPWWRARDLVRIAVHVAGRRGAGAPSLPSDLPDAVALVRACAAEGATVLLDHAGPTTAAWSPERAIGAAEIDTALEGRRPRALDEAGWQEITRAFVAGADACRAAGVAWGLALDDDGLLHDALRHAPDRARAIAAAVRAPLVALPVEDLAPGGWDATDGIALALALVSATPEAAGATTVVASSGSRAFAPLRWRQKGGTVGSARAALASAAWLVGRLPAHVAIAAIVPFTGEDVADIHAAARALGLARVHVELPAVAP
jgi:hypothetical protein